ncbi:MAG TPA: multidrug effflux MFS transporter [Azospirillum sp.]|nr:multidrug effflux MFS transporter [Azospirillum sp.]
MAPVGAGKTVPPLGILAGIAAGGPIALTLFLPSMPILCQQFAASAETVQLTLSLYFAGIAFGQLLYGPLSDRFGRRPVLLVGLCIYALSSLAGVFADSIETLIVVRVFQALGGCAGMVIVRAIVQDVYTGDRTATALSTILMASSIAPMLGPLIGGHLIEWFGWRAAFLLLAGVGGVQLWQCLIRLSETHHARVALSSPGQFAGLYVRVLAQPRFVVHAIASALVPCTYFAFLSGAPHFTITVMGRSPAEYGYLAMVLPAGFIAGNFVTTRITHRLGGVRMVVLGTAATAAALAAGLSLAGTLPLSPLALFAPMGLLTFGHGLCMSNLVSLTLREAQGLTGTAAALLGAMQMGIAALASRAAAHLVGPSATGMLLAMAAAHALAVALFLLGRRMAR